jgi:hypothetical protein
MEGDCLLYGDTTGELYRTRHEKLTTSDIFVVKLSQNDGSYSSTLEMQRGHFAAIGIGILLFLSCLGLCFCAAGGRWFQRRRIARKKADDYELNDGVFRDDPSIHNGEHRNGSSVFRDDKEENGNESIGMFELPMMSKKPYQD